jgi:hypothetical protein
MPSTARGFSSWLVDPALRRLGRSQVLQLRAATQRGAVRCRKLYRHAATAARQWSWFPSARRESSSLRLVAMACASDAVAGAAAPCSSISF